VLRSTAERCQFTLCFTLTAPTAERRKASVWCPSVRPSVCLSVCPSRFPWTTLVVVPPCTARRREAARRAGPSADRRSCARSCSSTRASSSLSCCSTSTRSKVSAAYSLDDPYSRARQPSAWRAGLRRRRARVQIAAATLSGNSLR